MSSKQHGAKFVVDVKSTGIFDIDPILKQNGATTDYWITGHSYMKRRCKEIGALCGFEKSGHYYLCDPLGRGYDDGIVAGIAILEMLDRAGSKKMSDLVATLPKTWGSPTMAPECPDDKKYGVVDAMVKEYEAAQKNGEQILGQKIKSLVTVNGVRVTLEDGTWGLVRRRRTSRRLSSWWRARYPMRRCARCSKTSMRVCANIRKSENTTRRSKGGSWRRSTNTKASASPF